MCFFWVLLGGFFLLPTLPAADSEGGVERGRSPGVGGGGSPAAPARCTDCPGCGTGLD